MPVSRTLVLIVSMLIFIQFPLSSPADELNEVESTPVLLEEALTPPLTEGATDLKSSDSSPTKILTPLLQKPPFIKRWSRRIVDWLALKSATDNPLLASFTHVVTYSTWTDEDPDTLVNAHYRNEMDADQLGAALELMKIYNLSESDLVEMLEILLWTHYSEVVKNNLIVDYHSVLEIIRQFQVYKTKVRDDSILFKDYLSQITHFQEEFLAALKAKSVVRSEVSTSLKKVDMKVVTGYATPHLPVLYKCHERLNPKYTSQSLSRPRHTWFLLEKTKDEAKVVMVDGHVADLARLHNLESSPSAAVDAILNEGHYRGYTFLNTMIDRIYSNRVKEPWAIYETPAMVPEFLKKGSNSNQVQTPKN